MKNRQKTRYEEGRIAESRLKPKKVSVVLAAILVCIFLASCGGQAPENDVKQPEGESTVTAGPEPSVTASPVPSGATAAPALVSSQNTSKKKDIVSETEQIFDVQFNEAGMENGRELDVQFYQGEPVMLWLKEWEQTTYSRNPDDTWEKKTIPLGDDGGVYLLRMDGSIELLIPAGDFLKENFWIQENNSKSQQYIFILDDAGNCYARTNYQDENVRNYFLKIDRNGEIVYKTVLEAGYYAKDFCTASDGRTYVVLQDSSSTTSKRTTRLVEFDPETGELSQEDAFCYQAERLTATIGEGPDGFYFNDSFGYRRIEEDGSSTDYMLFKGTSYSRWTDELGWGTEDFRVLVDGSVEVLYEKGYYSPTSYRVVKETLKFTGNEKTPVVIRANAVSSWLKSQAARFNRTNKTYQIVLEEFSGNSGDQEDYARLTSVEIASGKGPDMLFGDFMKDYICGLIDKGALEDLVPYMKSSGIKEEDYLPIAFGGLRDKDKIYGIQAEVSPNVYKIRSEVLGEIDDIDGISIETLMNALTEWKENAVFYMFYDSENLLRMFLKGSENLWGMIDWETGTCDFSGELFAQIMENARRYGYNARNKYPNLVQPLHYTTLTWYDSFEELSKEGMTRLGFLLDDGCYGATDWRNTMMINANSAQKTGAWEFITFLLAEDAQMAQMSIPVNKAALSVCVRENNRKQFENNSIARVGCLYVDEGEYVKVYKEYTYEDMTEERIEEYLGELEKVRNLPFRTAPVLDIVCEEAESYFNGSKSIRDVSAIIENRVRLYLMERN